MKIAICGSINFTPEIKKAKEELEKNGHEIFIPLTSERIINGELTMEDFLKEKEANGDKKFRESAQRKIKDDVINLYYKKIKEMDAILILNLEKNETKGYIGGNTFLEMGFAHVLNRKIFLLNEIPEIGYKDEIVAMKPVILEGDLNRII
jgi:predicted RNA-binding protein with PUA domain